MPKVIYNNFIPFKGYYAINIFGIIFVRGKNPITKVTLNHELIHTAQIKDYLYIFFYLAYIIEYIKLLFKYKFNHNKAYYDISFEQEAYKNQYDMNYLTNRRNFANNNYKNYGNQ